MKRPCIWIAIIISLRPKPKCSTTFAPLVIKQTSKPSWSFPGKNTCSKHPKQSNHWNSTWSFVNKKQTAGLVCSSRLINFNCDLYLWKRINNEISDGLLSWLGLPKDWKKKQEILEFPIFILPNQNDEWLRLLMIHQANTGSSDLGPTL